MIQEIKYYECDGHPQDEDIQAALDIIDGQDFLIELKWFKPYSGYHSVVIDKGDTIESVKERLPKTYGL